MRKFRAHWWMNGDLLRWRYALHAGKAVPEQEIYPWRRVLATKPEIPS